MQQAALMLNLAAVAATLALAVKYLSGEVPKDYHAAIFVKGGAPVREAHRLVLRAVYHAMAGGLIGVALAIAALTWFGSGETWTRYTSPLIGIAAGAPTAITAYRTEKATGVRTPWRPAVALPVVLIVAAILGSLG